MIKNFDNLSMDEQASAIDYCIDLAICELYDDLVKIIDKSIISEEEFKNQIIPLARKIAKSAYYCNSDDVVIKL